MLLYKSCMFNMACYICGQVSCYDEEVAALRERVACLAEELSTRGQPEVKTAQAPVVLKASVEAEDAEIQVQYLLFSIYHLCSKE